MAVFASGFLAAAFLIAALFFVKFWTRTRDALFLAFAVGFVLFAAEHVLLVVLDALREERTWLYLVRLVGFLLIIAGIVVKNRASGRSRSI
jgi:Family of unknown function (DUF5985)